MPKMSITVLRNMRTKEVSETPYNTGWYDGVRANNPIWNPETGILHEAWKTACIAWRNEYTRGYYHGLYCAAKSAMEKLGIRS